MKNAIKNIRDLLPIGSVVWIKNAKHAIMIFGVLQTLCETDEEYDYIGVPYPEGNMGNDTHFLFMHEDVERVEFKGFHDIKRENFLKILTMYYKRNEE